MAQGPPSLATAFNQLPIELNKAIAHYLDTDKDIATYRLICRGTNDAIDADRGSFWRAKFRENFDYHESRSNAEFKKVYQHRTKYLRRGTGYSFFRGYRRREMDVVAVLRDLIVESFQGPSELDEHGRPRCKNHDVLRGFVFSSKILLNDRRAPPPGRNEENMVSPALAAVKLMCSHFLLESKLKHNVFAVEESQYVVYMATSKAPLYTFGNISQTELNMNWVLHCMQFFRYHMMCPDVATLFDAMDDLSQLQKPSAWQEPLKKGSYPLGKHWKGTYSFLDPAEIKILRKIPVDRIGDEYLCDKNVDEGKIQSLELEFMTNNEHPWPPLFEQRLHSRRNTMGSQMTAQGRSKPKDDPSLKNIQFIGRGVDLEDEFNAVGWLNPLPDQHGIPGWQRITFMKHFMDDLDGIEQDNLWAYEGVVLPGGRIILGRWWFASEDVDFDKDYNGPFILWAVDEPDIEDEDEDDDSNE
ncbi:hypothetical protein GQ44DRAFT_648578 [Phaeosphaeriaceae sp. PMI808]|nr:hypothetical protein GQ44DRAFT_648578 [Phaeosphaeriaceae sp. PMI808]